MTGCACGHHHHHAPARIEGGEGIALDHPLVALSGTLTCQDAAQMMLALDLLPQHVSLSRAEPGVEPAEGPEAGRGTRAPVRSRFRSRPLRGFVQARLRGFVQARLRATRTGHVAASLGREARRA